METTIVVEPAEPEVRLRKFTIADYYKMAEAGILAWKERVELLDGYILQKACIAHKSFGLLRDLWAMQAKVWCRCR